MHRTQIYFEESFYEEIKKEALKYGKSVSAYIRDVLKKELEKDKRIQKVDFSEFAGLWEGRDIDTKKIRKKAWKSYDIA